MEQGACNWTGCDLLYLMNWIRHFCVITGPGGEVVQDLPSSFFVQIAQTLISYKKGANFSKLDLNANCKLDMLIKQMENIVKINPLFSSLWSECSSLPQIHLYLQNKMNIWLSGTLISSWSGQMKVLFIHSLFILCYN